MPNNKQRTCVFCGGTPVTAEDVLPLWISRMFVGKKDRVATYVGHLSPDHGRSTQQRRGAKRIELRVRQVCERCNNGWMSELETGSIPLLTPLIQGKSAWLDHVDQRAIARWAVKTATMMHYGVRGMGPVPDEQLRHIRCETEPPAYAAVWLAASAGTVQPVEYDIKSLTIRSKGPWGEAVTTGDQMSLCIGHLALQTFVWMPDDAPHRIQLPPSSRALRILPNDGLSIGWPPGDPLTDAELVRFFNQLTPNEPHAFRTPQGRLRP